jgi:plasmid replication initiation protein
VIIHQILRDNPPNSPFYPLFYFVGVISLWNMDGGLRGLMARELVTKSNSLVRATYSLTLGEHRLIGACAARVRKTGQGLTDKEPIEISAQEYSELYDLDKSWAYKELRAAADSLFERKITFKDEVDGKKGVTRIRWVQRISYFDDEGLVSVAFSTDVAPHITDMSRDFTSYYLNNIKNLSSPYAVRLYEQFARWRNAGTTPMIEIDELKRLMGIEPDRYTRIDVFRKLLNSHIDNISQKTDLTISYETKKRGRTIVGFVFHICEISETTETSTLKLSTYQQRTWAEKLVATMDFNKEIRHRLERFPESYSPNHAILINAVAEKLANPKIAATFLPLLRQVGFGKGGRKRPHKNEDIKPIRVVHEDGTVDDKTGDLFNGEG